MPTSDELARTAAALREKYGELLTPPKAQGVDTSAFDAARARGLGQRGRWRPIAQPEHDQLRIGDL